MKSLTGVFPLVADRTALVAVSQNPLGAEPKDGTRDQWHVYGLGAGLALDGAPCLFSKELARPSRPLGSNDWHRVDVLGMAVRIPIGLVLWVVAVKPAQIALVAVERRSWRDFRAQAWPIAHTVTMALM